MRDLETRLTELGGRWDPPATPDLVADVVARRRAAAPTRRPRPRRSLIALAASLATIGALAAIAPARNAILDFFDIGGVRVVTTTTPAPPPRPAPSPASGRPVTLDAARAQAPFALRVPTLLGLPDRVVVTYPPEDGAYTFTWTRAPEVADAALSLTQLRGELIARKVVDPTVTTVQEVDVDGAPGFWFSGGPHTFGYVDATGAFLTETTRAVGDLLIWERSGVTYRIEGARSQADALRVAASLR